MNFLARNCRGTTTRGFPTLIKDLKREYDASLFFLFETHVSGLQAQQQARHIGFSGSFLVDSRGQAGGIWCLWDAGSWRVEILESADQFVHSRVTWRGRFSWLITAVYASPRHNGRLQLWDELRCLTDTVDEPWVVLGDFNSIMAPHKRKGGSSNFSDRNMISFCNMIQSCDLLDAGFQGSPFTWKHANLFQRLDRVLINIQWRIRFESATMFHLPFFKSDHRVILVRMQSMNKPNRHRRSFRFVGSWLTHEGFPNLMNQTWERGAAWIP